jgi:hypothetical protein
MNEKTRTSRAPVKSPPQSVPEVPAANPLLKRWVQIAAALAVLVLVVVAVRAFMGGGRLSNFGREAQRLLDQKSVQAELKLSDDQLAKLNKLKDDRFAAMSFTATMHMSQYQKEKRGEQVDLAAEKSLPWILSADQLKRLKQIYYQERGKRPWSDKEIAEELKLTREQMDEIKGLQKDQQKAMGDLRKGGDPTAKLDDAQKQEAREKFNELRKNQDAQLMGVLTQQQQDKWQEMRGEPFTGALPMGGRGGGGRNGGGGGGGGGGRNRGGPGGP